MNPSTGTFISMDSYQGSIYDPVTLHKYLYANANPVMYTDPSGYFSLAGLATCTTASQIISASWKFITLNTIMGAVVGAACGAIDSILGGNDFSQVIKDAFTGLWTGALLGCVVSSLACFSVLYPELLIGLQIFQKASLVIGGVGAIVSLEEGNVPQAIFRALLAILAYKGTGKLIENVKWCYYNKNAGSYLAGKAPKQVSPGTRYLEGQYVNDQGKVQPWKAYYDEYGRLIARTDFNAGNRAQGIPEIHYHLYEWGPGKNPQEIQGHVEGEYMP